MNVPDIYTDTIGCYISLKPIVNAGPNARRFLQRPMEHASSLHPEMLTSKMTKTGAERSLKVQCYFTPAVEKKKVLVVEKPKPAAAEQNQVVLSGKYGRKMKFKCIGSHMEQSIQINQHYVDVVETNL